MALRDDALEPMLPANPKEVAAVVERLLQADEAPGGAALGQNAREDLLPRLDREAPQIPTPEREDVEHDVDDGDVRHRASCVAPEALDARAETLEIGPAPIVERDDLAVEDDALFAERLHRLGDLGIASRRVATLSIRERNAFVPPVGDDADAVQLELVEVARPFERAHRRLPLAEHRHDARSVDVGDDRSELGGEALRGTHPDRAKVARQSPKCKPRRRTPVS